MSTPSPTRKGLRVYFRTLAPDGSLHFIDFPFATGFREPHTRPEKTVTLIDSEEETVAILIIDAISCIIPTNYKIEEETPPNA